jgi:glycosyltransferase involved in cell wall biosynthesis
VRIALAHDYLTQRGGAERVALLIASAYPEAPIYTSLFHPEGTFPEFSAYRVCPSRLNRFSMLRRHHRLAMPFLARTTSRTRIDADVVLASSSGWAHGVQTSGRCVVYCHTPARWLYQSERYLGRESVQDFGARVRAGAASVALGTIGTALRAWDKRAAHQAHRYIANSRSTQAAIRAIYGLESEVLHPPPALVPGGRETPVTNIEPGFLLCVARLLPYKNVDIVIEAVTRLGDVPLVIVGEGPLRATLAALSAVNPRIQIVGPVKDDALRWLYRNCRALVACSYEDFGLSPLEAASFGRPTAALRAGGYLDTICAGETGIFFETPKPDDVADAVRELWRSVWDEDVLRRHAAAFSAERFKQRLREIVAEELLVLRSGESAEHRRGT